MHAKSWIEIPEREQDSKMLVIYLALYGVDVYNHKH